MVEVYWNSHKSCWSIRDAKTRRVIDHKYVFMLENCQFIVSQAGRLRVLQTGQKNIHAVVRGTIFDSLKIGKWIPVRYNPFRYSSFVAGPEEREIVAARCVYFGYNRTCEVQDEVFRTSTE